MMFRIIKGALLLYSLSFIVQAFSSLIPPLLSTFLVEMNATNLEIGVISGLGAITYVLMTPITGILSLKMDRRILLLSSFFIMSISLILFSTASSPAQLIPYNMLLILSVSLFWPVIESMLPTIQNSKSVIGPFGLSWSLGMMLSSMIVGLLVSLPKRSLFQVLSLFPLLLTPLLSLLKEHKVEDFGNRASARCIKSPLQLVELLLGGIVYASTIGTVFIFYPVYVVRREIEEWTISLILSLVVLARTLAFVLYNSIGEEKGKLLGPLLIVVGTPLLSLPEKVVNAVSSFIVGFGTGITYSYVFERVASSSPEIKGIHAGLFESSIGVGYLVGPLIAGISSEGDPGNAFISIVVLPFTVLLLNVSKKIRVR